MGLAVIIRAVQLLLTTTAVANTAALAQAPVPTHGDELVTWLIRGSISAVLLLLVWLFNRGEKILQALREDTDLNAADILELQVLEGIEPRHEDRGAIARRRRAKRDVGRSADRGD